MPRPARERASIKPCPDTLALPFEPITVRIPIAVKLTGIGRSKLYELIKSGDVETVKIGSATLVKVASFRRLTERGVA